MIGEPMTVDGLESYIRDLSTELFSGRANMRAIARYAERLQGISPYGRCVVARFSATGDCLGASIDGVDSDKPVALYSDMEQIGDGYNVGDDGARYRRYKPGQRTWWLMVGDEVAFVSTCKPMRTVMDDVVVYEWRKE